MSGISSAIYSQAMAPFLEIIVDEKEYSIGRFKFKREATNSFLLECTLQVLKVFQQLEWMINKQKSIDIDEDTCNKQLATLATWGQRAYEKFFAANAQNLLLHRFQMMKAMNAGIPSPTFISDMVPFPWEVLYEGDADVINKEQFWGLGY